MPESLKDDATGIRSQLPCVMYVLPVPPSSLEAPALTLARTTISFLHTAFRCVRHDDRRPRQSLRRPARHGPRFPHLYVRTSAPSRSRSIRQSIDVSTDLFPSSISPSAKHLHRSDDPSSPLRRRGRTCGADDLAASYRKAIRALINLSTSWQLASAALLSFDNLARSCISEDEGPEQKMMLALTSPVVEEAKRQAGRPLPIPYELDFEAFLGMTGDVFFDSQSA